MPRFRFKNIFVFITLVVMLISCKTKKDYILNFSIPGESLDGTWKMYKISSLDTTITNMSGNILFLHASLAKLQMEKNQCSGNYYYLGGDSISFSTFSCTMESGDSQFSDDLLMILQECSNFRLNNNDLKLFTQEGDTLFARKMAQ